MQARSVDAAVQPGRIRGLISVTVDDFAFWVAVRHGLLIMAIAIAITIELATLPNLKKVFYKITSIKTNDDINMHLYNNHEIMLRTIMTIMITVINSGCKFEGGYSPRNKRKIEDVLLHTHRRIACCLNRSDAIWIQRRIKLSELGQHPTLHATHKHGNHESESQIIVVLAQR